MTVRTSLIARSLPPLYILNMREFFRRFLLILCAVTLVGGSVMGLAAPAMADEPCAHEHGTTPVSHRHHGIDGRGCLACCIGGTCFAVAGDPVRPSVVIVPLPAMPVTYWAVIPSFTGQSLAPDPAPPRSRA